MNQQSRPDKRRRVKLAILAVAAAAFLLLAGSLAYGLRTEACISCHTPQAKTLRTSDHSSVRCLSCHLPAGAWSYPGFSATLVFRMYPKALTGAKTRVATSPVASAPCLECHKDVMVAKKVVSAKGLRIKHSTCTSQSATCSTCHPATAHAVPHRVVRGPTMDQCVVCHDRRGVDTTCESCHTGRVDVDTTTVRTAFSITHGRDWRTTHGLGRLDSCRTCHRADSCVRCHGVAVPHPSDFGSTHGAFATRDRKSCATCHDVPKMCSDCHGIEMPHPAGFLKRHSSVADSLDDPVCSRCHEPTDCRRCHERHIHPGGARGVPVPPKPGEGGSGR